MNEICKLDDIIPETGVCALVNGEQVAIFRTHHDEVSVSYTHLTLPTTPYV